MSWRWDDAAYDVAEDHGQHVEGSLGWYDDWEGPEARAHRILAGHVDRVIESLASRLTIPTVGGKAESTVRAGVGVGAHVARPPFPLCVVCGDAGCSHCPGVAA